MRSSLMDENANKKEYRPTCATANTLYKLSVESAELLLCEDSLRFTQYKDPERSPSEPAGLLLCEDSLRLSGQFP